MNDQYVQFIDTSQECMKMMKKLTKKGLNKAGKIFNNTMRPKIPVRRGLLQKAVMSQSKIDKNTGVPYLEMGYLTRKKMKQKYGIKYYINPSWMEFGTKSHWINTKQYKKGIRPLTYELEGNGRKYGYFVHHPGQGTKNFLRNTAYEVLDEMADKIQESLSELEDYVIEKGMSIDVGGDEEID